MHFRSRFRLALLLTLLAWPATAPAQDERAARTIGSVTLDPCEAAAPDGWCGAIERPLDPSGTVSGTISIGFEWYPNTGNSPFAGTLVAVQGGPGFATTAVREGFREMLGRSTLFRDLILLDLRGTGTSGAIDCPALQANDWFDAAAEAACARQLGDRAGLYGTAAAADDLAALLDALALKRIDLYGVSYGTMFGQAFARLHGDRLDTLVLDSAVPIDLGPFDRATQSWRGFERALDAVCKRAAACTPAAWRADLDRMLASIRADPDADLTASDLLETLMDAGRDGLVYREFDAAAAAWLRGDRGPFWRLAFGTRMDFADIEPSIGSAGANRAVSCVDRPMAFAVDATPEIRRAQALAALLEYVARRAALFEPFHRAELMEDPEESGFCADWPAPSSAVVPLTALAVDGPYPPVPTLVLSGDLDTVTPPALGALVAGRFPHAIHLVVPNAMHGAARTPSWVTPTLWDPVTDCVPGIIAQFVALRTPGDTSCLAARPALRVLRDFPRRLADVVPAEAGAGRLDESDLRIAASVAAAVGDAVAHFGRPQRQGLRGGWETTYRDEGGYVIYFDAVPWVEDVALSGRVNLDSAGAIVTGAFSLNAPDGVSGLLSVGWVEREDTPVAVVTGTLEGGPLGRRPIFARLPAP